MEDISGIILKQIPELSDRWAARLICRDFCRAFNRDFRSKQGDPLSEKISVVLQVPPYSGRINEDNCLSACRLNLIDLIITLAKHRKFYYVYKKLIAYNHLHLIPRLVEAKVSFTGDEFGQICSRLPFEMVVSLLPITYLYDWISGAVLDPKRSRRLLQAIRKYARKHNKLGLLKRTVSQYLSKLAKWIPPQDLDWVLRMFQPSPDDISYCIRSENPRMNNALPVLYRHLPKTIWTLQNLYQDDRLPVEETEKIGSAIVPHVEPDCASLAVKLNSLSLLRSFRNQHPDLLSEKIAWIFEEACKWDAWRIVEDLIPTTWVNEEMIISGLFLACTYCWNEQTALILAKAVEKMDSDDFSPEIIEKINWRYNNEIKEEHHMKIEISSDVEGILITAVLIASDRQCLDSTKSVCEVLLKGISLDLERVYLTTCSRGWSPHVIWTLLKYHREKIGDPMNGLVIAEKKGHDLTDYIKHYLLKL